MAPTPLTLGYQLDPLKAQLKDILITYPMDQEVVWWFSIQGRGIDIAPKPREIFDTEPGPRLSLKRKKKNDMAESEG